MCLRGEKIKLKCEQCGGDFEVVRSKSRYNASRFCGKDCYNASRKKGEVRNCLWCKQPFYQTAYQVNRYDKRWCSVDHKKRYLANAVAKEVEAQ